MTITVVELASNVPDYEKYIDGATSDFQTLSIYRSGLIKWGSIVHGKNPEKPVFDSESLRVDGGKTAEILDAVESAIAGYREPKTLELRPTWHMTYWVDGTMKLSVSGNMGDFGELSEKLRGLLVSCGLNPEQGLWLFGNES